VGVTFYPDSTVRGADGINVGSDREGGQQAKGMIENLITYNYPLSSDEIWRLFEGMAGRDSDGDGVSDIHEHEQGTDPSVNNLTLTVEITVPRKNQIIP
jgi:hypothetical protein